MESIHSAQVDMQVVLKEVMHDGLAWGRVLSPGFINVGPLVVFGWLALISIGAKH